MTGKLMHLFPLQRRLFWQKIALEEENISEIRLRVGQPIVVCTHRGDFFVDKSGNCTVNMENAAIISEEEVKEILQHVCQYSLYAYEDEIRQGFITVSGGHRIGVSGQAVMEGERIRTMKHISCLNIRIAHEIKGAADPILSMLYQNREICSTLIISAPGCGKTTLLRDLIRQVSDGNCFGEGKNVGLVDERSEIAGCFQGIPQNDVGIRTDVLDACPKALGMMLLLRAMAPQVMAVDEIGGNRDMEAIRLAATCGCKVLATVHGLDIEDVRKKEGIGPLLQEKLFERFVILGKADGRYRVLSVTGKEYYND